MGLNNAYQVPVNASDPVNTEAAITREQYQYFQDNFRPIEDEVLSRALDPSVAGVRGQKAADAVRDRFAAQEGQWERRASRFGVTPTQDQKMVAERLRGLRKASSMVGAENSARANTRDQSLESLGAILNIGKGIQSGALRSAGSAASMARSRDQFNRDAAAAHEQDQWNTAATAVGLAAAFGV